MGKETEHFIGLFLPPGTLDYFSIEAVEIKEGKEKYMGKYGFDDHYTIVLKEKERQSLPKALREKGRLRTKGYSEKRLEDFPIRGRKTTLLFKRRKLQVEGQSGIYQLEFDISAERVKYTKEFAFFFEGTNRESSR
jgi:hypothetical protein